MRVQEEKNLWGEKSRFNQGFDGGKFAFEIQLGTKKKARASGEIEWKQQQAHREFWRFATRKSVGVERYWRKCFSC